MNKIIIVTSFGAQVLDLSEGSSASLVASQSGVTDPALYQEFAESDFDSACYNFPQAFSLTGGVVSFDLTAAKSIASSQEKGKFTTLEDGATTGYSANQLASQGSLAEVDRLPEIQLVLDAVNTLAVELSANLAAIDAATTIDEVNNIVNPPTGIINIGRGQFGGPLDLNESTYVTFNSVSLTQSETELYVPGTGITLAYGALSPGGFNSAGPCFNTGDYLIQIRRVSDSFVIAELEVPLSTDGSNEDIPF
jgi:hypothetical protein